MTDCSNAEMRDLLPDYVHDRLSVSDLARLEQHLVSCAECTDEVALLQQVFDVRPEPAPLNSATIVASLPKPGVRTEIGHSDLGVEGIRNIATARSAVAKHNGFRGWRVAAALAVVTVGGLSVSIARQGFNGSGSNAPLADTSEVLASNLMPTIGYSDSAPTTPLRQVSLSVGDMSDYTDEEMEAIMARLDKWDGAASTDPLPGVPILPPGS